MRWSGLKEGWRQPGSLPVTALIRATSCSLGGAFSLPPPPKQLASQNGGLAFRSLDGNTSWVAVPCRSGQGSPEGFLCSPSESRIHSSRNQGEDMGVAPLPLTSSTITPSESFLSGSHNFLLCWPSWRVQFQGRNASTRRHNNDSTELEVRTATQPLWAPHASGVSRRRRAVTVLAGVTYPDFQGETRLHNGGEEYV